MAAGDLNFLHVLDLTQMCIFSYEGDADANLLVECGFAPKVVWVKNADGDAEGFWCHGMTEGYMIKRTATTWSLATSAGITPVQNDEDFDKDTYDSAGFYIGQDSDLNADAETIFGVAFG